MVVGGLGFMVATKFDPCEPLFWVGGGFIALGLVGGITGIGIARKEGREQRRQETEAWKVEDAEFSSALRELDERLTDAYNQFPQRPAFPKWQDAASKAIWPSGLPLPNKGHLRDWDKKNGDPFLMTFATWIYPTHEGGERYSSFDEIRRTVKRKFLDIWGDRYKLLAADVNVPETAAEDVPLGPGLGRGVWPARGARGRG
jgi:hypothetical protein